MKKAPAKKNRMLKDEVKIEYTPLYLHVPHTRRSVKALPLFSCLPPSLSLRLLQSALQSYMKGIRQAWRAECRVTAANGVMARPDKHPASNEKALRLPSSPVTMQLLNRVIAR